MAGARGLAGELAGAVELPGADQGGDLLPVLHVAADDPGPLGYWWGVMAR